MIDYCAVRGREPADDVSPRAVSRATPARTGNEFDLLVVGTGAAGMAAALQGAEMGARVGIAEDGILGGTCVNVGCIPSKSLIEAAAHFHAVRRGFPGIAGCEPRLDWEAVIRGKNRLVAELGQTRYADVLASYPQITLLRGRSRLLGGGRLRVGGVQHRAGKIVLATGTSPVVPPIPGLAEVGPLDSTSAMELSRLPRSMIVLGGSAVGLELGQTFARFGTSVTLLEVAARLLPNEDETVSEALRGYLHAEGLEIHTGVNAVGVRRDGSQIVVAAERVGAREEFRADTILVAAGRRANTDDLGLREAGVALTAAGFIQVGPTLRTSAAGIYAAGDVTGGPGYVYVAAAGGRLAAENALSATQRELDLRVVPNVTFTSPQVGSVGLTETQARAAGHDVRVSVLEMGQVPRALVSHDGRGLVKLVSDGTSGRLLGVHAVAPHAGELMGEAALAIRFGLTAGDLTGTLHPYLTWGESVKLAAQGFTMDLHKLSCCA